MRTVTMVSDLRGNYVIITGPGSKYKLYYATSTSIYRLSRLMRKMEIIGNVAFSPYVRFNAVGWYAKIEDNK